jgi:hypothetical protein
MAAVLPTASSVSRSNARTRHTGLLTLVGVFGGTAHELPDEFYAGGLGPFDLLVLILLMRWLSFPRPQMRTRAFLSMVPFYLFAIFAYIGEISGGMHFTLTSWSSVVAPLRFVFYPSLFFTLTPLLIGLEQLRVLFSAYILGVLALCVLAVFRSVDPGFFYGLPVLYDPNVVGNFISYAMIALGFGFMPRMLLFRGSLLGALFGFALFTFSKATWILSVIGIYINAANLRLWKVVTVVVCLAAAFFIFADWQRILLLATSAIDMKLTAAAGNEAEGGSFFMRLSFLISSLYGLTDYPLGVGLKNFWALNHTYAHAQQYYFDSESPHMAFGYAMVQAGWVGLILLGFIYCRVLAALFALYGAPRLLTKVSLAAMITISVLFQIEFITQPFIYLVLAAALACSERAAKARTQ